MNDVAKHIRLLIVNGVNLDSIGTREINIYGSTSFQDYLSVLRKRHPDVEIECFQSDNVGEITKAITGSKEVCGIILNAGAYTHECIAVADAVRAANCPVIEVHISNVFARENYRRNNVLTSSCLGSISGFGLESYELAVSFFIKKYCDQIKLHSI